MIVAIWGEFPRDQYLHIMWLQKAQFKWFSPLPTPPTATCHWFFILVCSKSMNILWSHQSWPFHQGSSIPQASLFIGTVNNPGRIWPWGHSQVGCSAIVVHFWVCQHNLWNHLKMWPTSSGSQLTGRWAYWAVSVGWKKGVSAGEGTPEFELLAQATYLCLYYLLESNFLHISYTWWRVAAVCVQLCGSVT